MMHPLDQLSAEEIQQAVSLARTTLQADAATKLRFVAVTLAEPNKAELEGFARDGVAPSRAAECVVLLPATGVARELVLDLATGAVVREKTLPAGTQPMFSPDDCSLAEAIVKADAGVQRTLKERYGIENIDEVACDPWSVHFADDADRAAAKWQEGAPQGRLIQVPPDPEP